MNIQEIAEYKYGMEFIGYAHVNLETLKRRDKTPFYLPENGESFEDFKSLYKYLIRCLKSENGIWGSILRSYDVTHQLIYNEKNFLEVVGQSEEDFLYYFILEKVSDPDCWASFYTYIGDLC